MTADEAFWKANEPQSKTTPTSLAACRSISLCLLLSHRTVKILFTVIDLQLSVSTGLSQEVTPLAQPGEGQGLWGVSAGLLDEYPLQQFLMRDGVTLR